MVIETDVKPDNISRGELLPNIGLVIIGKGHRLSEVPIWKHADLAILIHPMELHCMLITDTRNL